MLVHLKYGYRGYSYCNTPCTVFVAVCGATCASDFPPGVWQQLQSPLLAMSEVLMWTMENCGKVLKYKNHMVGIYGHGELLEPSLQFWLI